MYLGRNSSLSHIWLHSMEIFCLQIFVLILSSFRIYFMILIYPYYDYYDPYLCFDPLRRNWVLLKFYLDFSIYLSLLGNKAWAAANKLTLWKTALSDKINQQFFQAVAVSVLLSCYTTWT